MSSTDRPITTRPTVAQREAAEELLRRAAGEGLLTLEEYGERVAVVLAAETHDELQAVTADLPATVPEPVAEPRRRRPPRRWLIAIVGGHDERGRWRPAPTTTALAIMGGVNVDLREAEVEQGELTLDAIALMGGIEIIVPEGVEVEMTGFAFMGGRELKVRQPDSPSAPLLRVRAYALMGAVEVRNPKSAERSDRPAAVAASDARPATWSRSDVPARREPPRESWWGKLIGAAAAVGLLAFLWNGPLNIGDADALAVFSGAQYTPSGSELIGADPVNATAVFGGVEVIIPEGYTVDVQGSLALFGSTNTDSTAIDAAAGDNPQGPIVVRPRALFGGVEITSAAQAEFEEQDRD